MCNIFNFLEKKFFDRNSVFFSIDEKKVQAHSKAWEPNGMSQPFIKSNIAFRIFLLFSQIFGVQRIFQRPTVKIQTRTDTHYVFLPKKQILTYYIHAMDTLLKKNKKQQNPPKQRFFEGFQGVENDNVESREGMIKKSSIHIYELQVLQDILDLINLI